ncbi:MAG: alpha/beta hydrolase [Bacteroidia bacterium]|nr:alpha/beta hydrolase [Bacteroidia bacterium]MDW8014969.1 alpha/beta hydrolase [Bacteroidia bacterium]
MRLACLLIGSLFAQSGRYWDSLFSWRMEVITYGEATSVFGLRQTLWANFFLPEGDSERQRPIIVLLFGGAYVSGSRNDADITHIARYFAARGYVAATIDYRIGVPLPIASEWIKAGIRAVHDLKAFIRFLKRSVVEMGNPYGIDTARIYVGGSSAGGFTALHAAYITTASELAQVREADTTFLAAEGGIEGRSGNPGYSSRFTAVFSLSGGILSLEWIQREKVPAVICMHGSADVVVPYRVGILSPINLQAAGGYAIDSVAFQRGLYHALFTWEGQGHVPYGTQQTVNPLFMKDVEEFLRFHFYQWNRRFATSLSSSSASTERELYEIWSVEGRFIGEGYIKDLPNGLWVLRRKDGIIRRLYRP